MRTRGPLRLRERRAAPGPSARGLLMEGDMALRPIVRRNRGVRAVRHACAPVLETLENRQLLTILFYEGFDSLAWQNSREEGPQSGQGTAAENVWTNVPPTGWA